MSRSRQRDDPRAPLFRAELTGPASGAAAALTCAAGEVAALPDDDVVVATLAGERRSRRDRIELAGRRLDRRGPAGRVRAGLAVVRGTDVASDVSVLDHLAAATGRRRAAEILDHAPLLAARRSDPAGVLSGGERRILGWLLAAAAEPRVVVLDRAGTGLDPEALRWGHLQLDVWVDAGVGILLRPGRTEEHRWLTHREDGRLRTSGPRV